MNKDLTTLFQKARQDKELVVIEGFHALKHALRFNAEIVHICAVEPGTTLDMARTFAPDIEISLQEHTEKVPEDVFEKLPKHSFHTGVIAIAKKPKSTIEKTKGRIVYLENPRDPWNVGAVIRVAAAANAAGVVTTGTMNPWDATAIVSSVGLHFALPVVGTEILPTDLGKPVVVFDAEEKTRSEKVPNDAVFVFGEERRGVSEKTKQNATHHVGIPMQEGVSSLNLATAVAVALYAF